MKINFKKLIILIFVLSFFGLGLALKTTIADDWNTGMGTIEGPTGNDDIFDFINRGTRLIRPVVAIAFLFIIVYGGFTRMTAAGDPEKEKKSMSILTAGIIGFVIIVLAPFVVDLITSILGIDNVIQ